MSTTAPSGPAARRAALRSLLAAPGAPEVTAMLVTDVVNVGYLTGFTGSTATLLLHRDGDDASVLCTDFRYRDQAAAEAPDLPMLIDRGGAKVLAATFAERGLAAVGFESGHVTVDAHAALVEKAGAVALRRAPGLVERLRVVKDEDEIAVLRRACAVADDALAAVLAAGELHPGRTERQVASALETAMRERGADGPAFETIVAAGPHAAVPHHRPGDAALRRGDLVKMDFGALVAGYHSDITRTVVLGPSAAWQREVHALVADAQAAGRAALAPGAEVVAVDAAARDLVRAAGHDDHFGHGLGHGVGLQIHEDPYIGKEGSGHVAAGMVVTVEPGVYLPDRGGVRIEDTVVVRDGGVEVLTRAPRELLEV